ncbi:MAG: efflux RND transporter periplasmic adaptor subunit [Bacteroidia bacterium]
MKKLIILLMLAAGIQACSGNGEGDLDAKKKELSEKKAELKEIEKEIKSLQIEIAKLDTSTNYRKNVTLVEVDPVDTGIFRHFIEIQGTAKSRQNVQVYPDVSGQILQILVREGQRVSEGQLLAKLDNDIIARNIEELETAYDLANTTFEKQERLWKQDIGSEMQYLQAKNQKESLENQINSARAQLSKTQITAPINGMVDEVMLNPGEMANPAQPLFRVVNLDKIEVSAEVSERYIGKIETGDTALVSFPSLNLDINVPVTYVSQVVNPGDRTFRVDVLLDNRDKKIKPNVMAVLKLNDYTSENTVIVPTHVVQQSNRGAFVFVADKTNEGPVAKKVFIEPGNTYDLETEVLTGLSGNERLITRGYQDLTDGDPIRLKSETAQNQL